MLILGTLGVLLCFVTGTQAGLCSPLVADKDLLPCAGKENADANSCSGQFAQGGTCCYRQGVGCSVPIQQVNIDASAGLRTFVSGASVPTRPTSGELRGFVQRIPSGNNPQVQTALGRGVNPNFQRNALQSTLTLGLLLGTGGIANLFPKCPVHVKLCYRVPCGGYGDTRGLDNNPGECLKDPTCCYDYELAFLKSIFGPTVMGGAPACYYGPTSQQWRYITNFFSPWNPWFTNFIVEAFKEVFNTKLFNIGGQVLCQFNFQVKNYPVGSKSELECNLVSGCWDSSRPVGKQCTLASSIIKNIFGGFVTDDAIYPSLFTDDFDDTRCVSNWFDFGPKAYRRMECDVKDEPTELVQKITDWCPWQDCCLNYAAFSPSQLGQLSLINAIGGGGSPIGGGLLPISGGLPSIGSGGSIFGNQFNPGGGLSTPANANLLYLIAASSSSSLDLEKLFCPYRNLFATFIDLTETTEGCCDIPKCYHKKQYIRPARPTPPPTPPPPIYPGQWGQWGQCSGGCGQQGSRTRSCFVNGGLTSSTSCAGSESETCFGPPCPQVSYSWGSWTTSGCSVTCGGGTLTYTRPCLNNFQQSVDSSLCPGGASSGTSAGPCNTFQCPVPTPPPASYSWGQWTTSACSATCGGGTLSYSRPCLNNFGQPVDSSLCPGGASAGTATTSCATNPCPLPPTPPPASYSWGQWQASGCSVTCGGGTLTYTRPCQNNFGQTVDSSLCPGGAAGGTATTTCGNEICPANGVWGPWQDSTSCSATCGMNRIKQQTRICTANGVPRPDACVGESTRASQCPDIACPQQYYWTGYTLDSSCTYDSTTGLCSRKQTRYCYQKISQNWILVQPQSQCPGQSQTTQNCDFSECFSG